MSKIPKGQVILRLNYEKKADKFLPRNSNRLSKDDVKLLVIKAVKKLTGKNVNVDLAKMKGEYEGYFRIRKGDLRIIFNADEDKNLITVTITNIDLRRSVYK